MKLIESKAEYIPQYTVPSASPEGLLEGIYKMIELCGRTCYKSEDKITEDSAKGFVDRMIKSNHTAMLEHGTVYLAIPYTDEETLSHYRGAAGKYNEIEFTKYSKVTMMRGTHNYVTSNYRVLVENNWLGDLKYFCSPTEFHEKRYTMKFTCSRAISHELVRSRTMSFAQESQRYINYSKERHGGEVTFIQPYWADFSMGKMKEKEISIQELLLINAYQMAESSYFELLRKGLQPQQARDVLPNATKTELIITGFSSDWRFLMDLRLFGKTGTPHPDMVDLMQKAQKSMQEAGIWNDIMKYPSKFE